MDSIWKAGKLPFSFVKTLFLFGKSDIPAATLPTMAIALVLAGPSSLVLVLKGFIWSQLHLLTFQVKNQIDGIQEDRIAKPHRPLPAGRITLSEATTLYYILFCLMWIDAINENTVWCTLTYSLAILVYNEGGLAAIPVLKNVIGAIGLGCYCWGTTIILDGGKHVQGLRAVAVLMITAIFATTGHAQDFRDRSADKVRGRLTIPLLAPSMARWSLVVTITAWTVGLVMLWKPPALAIAVYVAVFSRCTGGFLVSDDEKSDYMSYYCFGFLAAISYPSSLV